MSLQPVSIKLLLLKLMLWLPISFAIWYFTYPALLYLSSILVNISLPFISNHIIDTTQLNRDNISLDIITNFIDLIPNDPTGKKGKMAFTIHVMKYGYGLALFIALVLSSFGSYKIKIRNILLGILLVSIIQLWGISFEVYKNLIYEMGTKVYNHIAPSVLLEEFIKLGYFLGILIIPAVAPVALWFSLYKKVYVISKGMFYTKL